MDKILISDIHGVLADLHTPWLNIYNQESGDNLAPEKITAWEIGKFVLPEWKDRIWEIYERDDLPEMVPPIDGAYEGIVRLRERGWRVLFATSPSNNENSYRWYRWLEAHKFANTKNDFLVARDKSMIRGRVIVDDRFDTVIRFHQTGNIGLLYDQPWNHLDNAFFRVKNWDWVIATVDDDDLIIRGQLDTTKIRERFQKLGLLSNE